MCLRSEGIPIIELLTWISCLSYAAVLGNEWLDVLATRVQVVGYSQWTRVQVDGRAIMDRGNIFNTMGNIFNTRFKLLLEDKYTWHNIFKNAWVFIKFSFSNEGHTRRQGLPCLKQVLVEPSACAVNLAHLCSQMEYICVHLESYEVYSEDQDETKPLDNSSFWWCIGRKDDKKIKMLSWIKLFHTVVANLCFGLQSNVLFASKLFQWNKTLLAK